MVTSRGGPGKNPKADIFWIRFIYQRVWNQRRFRPGKKPFSEKDNGKDGKTISTALIRCP